MDIKFDVLNTKFISDLIYSEEEEEIKDLKKKIGLNDDNYDLYTYLTFEFKNFLPQFEFDEEESSIKVNLIIRKLNIV